MATGTRRTETSAPAGTGNAESGNIFPARKIDLLNKELEEAEENVRELQKNLEAYSKISAYDWYKPHQDIFHSETAQTIQTTKTCMELIDELTRQANQFTQVQASSARK